MNLNLLVPINSLGFGVAGSNITFELAKTNRVSLFPIGGYDPTPAHRPVFDRLRLNTGHYDDSAWSVRIFHQDQLAEHVGGGPKAGFPFFELDRLRSSEVHHMNRMDRVLVASEWAARVAVESGVGDERVAVVPLGVDREVFNESVKPDVIYGDQTVFFTVGKFEIRKGHDFILRCFNRAFEPSDPVVLRMMAYNPLIGEAGNNEWEVSFQTSKMGAAGRIELAPRARTQSCVAAFMMAGDFGLFPARAEGWNLDLLEAMACGKMVVATNYAAHTAYCNSMNSCLIATDETEDAFDGRWFNGEGRWAKLGKGQEDQMVEYMRSLHRAKQCGAPVFNLAGVSTAKNLSWANSASKLVENLV